MHHSACKMLGWGHLEEPTDSRNLRALPSPHFPPLWKVHARFPSSHPSGSPRLPAAAAPPSPTLEECDPPLLLSSRRRQGGRQHMAPFSLARGGYLGNEKPPCPPSPMGRSCPPPLHILHKFSDTQPSYVQLCGELTAFLPPPTPQRRQSREGSLRKPLM